MKDTMIIIDARITPEIFREFAVYDTLIRQKRWRTPALFAGIMCAFGIVCFTQRERAGQAALLGCVLIGIGLVLPAVYFAFFFRSVRDKGVQIKKKEAAYTVSLTPSGLNMTKGDRRLDYTWDKVEEVRSLKRSVCVYFDRAHVLLLPGTAEDESRIAAWDFIAGQLPRERVKS